ncbi:hypothetical protein [Xanthomonas graminis]|uniref:Uncharacterized protein n=1 Tax=Xanthomonas graminis pv. phlei TaxID=487906 RepID=A0A0K2ZNN0_9XANT|nr:hypothetical protein [Xanthomonas translucens]UKE64520.1 hypothetical protein KM547_12085 [Xanthomonas translucens pv. phlei]UKE74784.1 hypothetical protein KFS85_07850 [Xanthomonas translucens pv. phleipratensis]CTP84985.1 hypothetical protein XTPLMG730_0975 [Xanthomonas translucens pv. phlei]
MNAAPWPIVDTPNTHGMFMLGTTTVYLSHMPMFGKQDHHYQLTLQIGLDADATQAYLADKANHPDQVYNLSNLDSDRFTLPDLVSGKIARYSAAIYRGYSNAGGGTPGPVIVEQATVSVQRIVYFRAFDQNTPRPTNLAYLLFGDGRQAHLDHYIALDQDFQHLLTLPAVPTWLSVEQLQAGVLLVFPQPSVPIGCSAPLQPGTHRVLFQGLPSASVPLQLGASYWYSTGNMLNAQDPCQSA